MEHETHIVKIATTLKTHIEADDKFQNQVGLDLVGIRETVEHIATNHLTHMQASMENMDKSINSIALVTQEHKTDIDWLKRFQWLVVSSAIGSLIVQLFK